MTARLGRWMASLDDLESRMKGVPMVRRYGRLTKITGLVMEAEGIKMPLGATCYIERNINGGQR
ncbi:Flagellum-specific ATP synthase [Providencia rustigianii]|nr:Flagellum-specific ATP synthase [Providencia rustigianii]